MTQVAPPIGGGDLILDQRVNCIGIRHAQQRFGQTHQRNALIGRQTVFCEKNLH
nr:hypothetical protein [Roseobacter litoralis]